MSIDEGDEPEYVQVYASTKASSVVARFTIHPDLA